MIEKELRPGTPFYINLISNVIGCSQCNDFMSLPDDFDIKNKQFYQSIINDYKKKHKECKTKWIKR